MSDLEDDRPAWHIGVSHIRHLQTDGISVCSWNVAAVQNVEKKALRVWWVLEAVFPHQAFDSSVKRIHLALDIYCMRRILGRPDFNRMVWTCIAIIFLRRKWESRMKELVPASPVLKLTVS
jgi:hypothetical protein